MIFLNKEGHTELGYIQFQALKCQFFTLTGVMTDDTHLVSKHDFGRQVIVGGNLSKRIVLVDEGLVEVLACLTDIFLHCLSTYLTA